VTREELDADRTDAAAVEAQLATARWNLDHAVLRAPFEGKVTGRRIELGEVVAAGAPAYTLLAVDTLQVEVAVPARDLAGLALDRPIAVRAADQPEITAFGALDHPPVAGDPRSGAVTLVVNVPDPEGRFLPGTLVECAVVARNASPGSTAPAMASPGSSMCSVVVPLSALRVTTRGPVVFRVRDGRVESVPVRTGPVRGDAVRILSGLRPGDTIVNEIPDRLRDGDPVSIAPPAARVSAHGARVSE
jgi:RND family efflux transporter MFP subunit